MSDETKKDSQRSEVMELEENIRVLHEKGDFSGATTVAIEGYGPEILGFLIAIIGEESEAREVFAQVCEDLWSGVRNFKFKSSFRTWAYALARHALSKQHRDKKRWNHKPLSQVSEVRNIKDQERTITPPPFRTEVKERVVQLRKNLSEEEQSLLILRIDRKLSWNEVAQIMLGPDIDQNEEAIKKKATTCRKRFERIKDRLRKLAEQEGLLGDDDP